MALPAPRPAANDPDLLQIGRYVVNGTLGSGAMGTVYRAEDPMIERTVALKVLAIDMHTASQSGFRERFFREAKSAGRLSHPNIVTIYDVGESHGTPYIAMEFLPGLTLRESLDSGVVLPVRKIVDIATLVARGLDYAHHNGVIHRDIKPANIMLTRSGTVKIMDFGIALATDASRTMTDAVLGSPKYMAPEQISNGQVDGRTDLFALGVILYEMLTGKDAFAGESIPEVMHKVLHVTPVSPASLNPDIPPELDSIVMRALARDPADRFQRAKEMGRALGALRRVLRAPASESGGMAGEPAPISAAVEQDPAPVSAQPRPPPRTPGHPVLIGIALALVLVIAFATLIGPGTQTPAEAPAAAATAASEPPAPVADVQSEVQADAGGGELSILNDPEPLESGTPETYAPVPAPVAAAARAQPGPRVQAKPAAPPAQATVSLAVLPWGEVHVNGKLHGVTPPLREIELAPGKHQIEIRNADFPPHVETVTLESGQSHRINHRFRQ